MTKWFLFVTFLFLSQPIYSIRPIFTEDPSTIEESSFSVESGFLYDNRNLSYDVTLLYGFTKNLEVALKTNYINRHNYFYTGAHVKYSFDFITLKAEYLKNINLDESILSFGFSKYFYENKFFSTFGSVGFTKNTYYRNSIFYSLASSFSVEKKTLYIDLFFESEGSSSVFSRHFFKPIIGLNYSISKNVNLDCGYRIEIHNKKKISDNYIGGTTLYF